MRQWVKRLKAPRHQRPRLRGLINAVLRNYQRQQEELDAHSVSHNAGKYGHPELAANPTKTYTLIIGKT